MADNTPRTVALSGGTCGLLSSGIVAVSLNITVFSITGATGNGVFKVGDTSPPTTAWINYPPTETQRGNAGAMSVDNSTQIVVQVNQGGGSVQLTVDVNGYYPNDVTGTTGQDNFLFRSANTGAFGTMRVQNRSTTGANAYAITAFTASETNGAGGIFAQAQGLNGNVFGLKAESMSPDRGSAGVKGIGQ